ncbi:hypothetical protein FSS13T_22220 [Flavobacterium saliperosum S13]|uniref:Uncharacterized protein n=2 Tax=Flavobacterium saliperosum TaxID=329186 RepID=A0A1G4VRB0_9FLAO|nr:hypothetical protein [Flavobacterium saliperosum]ESU23914.1 hypothetical protein FSS13T_22220 [Flavobacterium saliperosum S13]SCX09930.1 hypothetical protein SAMN02927925_01472 [Flavobacterium saliperosum]
MRKFVIKVLFILILSIIAILLTIFLLNKITSERAKFKIKSSVTENLILGHSQPECAYNDSLISGFLNLSKSAESYFYNYIKLRKILEQNKGVKRVFIEFSNNQIEKGMNNWIWGDELLSERYSRYAPFMSFNEHLLICSNNRIGFLKNQPIISKRNFEYIIKNDYDFTTKIGGYNRLSRCKTDSILKFSNKANKVKAKFELSRTNIEYLIKIIDLCEKNKIKVFLIRTPMHPKNEILNNEISYQKILKEKFKDVDYLDFIDFPLDNSEFGDLAHLNFRGAEKYSLFFNNLIKDSLLFKNDKQKMINSKIAEFRQNLIK